MADDVPPEIPLEIRENMNFIFGKNAFFGVAPASDGVSHPLGNADRIRE
jgi:hypothetical protein